MPKLTLDFEFDEDNGLFSIASTEMVSVYQEVMSAVEVSSTLHNCMLPMWLEGQRKGDPKMTLAALSPLAGSNAWKWPDFERWRARFKDEARTPQSWTRADEAAKAWPDFQQAKRMLLLHDTLTSAVYSRREYLHWQHPHRANKEWEFDKSVCNVEKAISGEFGSSVVMSDWSTWPPFFPGDHSRPGLKLTFRNR